MTHNQKPYWNIDRVIMRLKDVMIFGAALWAIFITSVKYYPLPDEVEAQAATIKNHETRIQKVEDAFSDMAEIKTLLRKEIEYSRIKQELHQ